MDTPPDITDRTALMRNRNRAEPDALFLHDVVADEIKERLIEVNRTFTSIAIVTSQPAFWASAFPDATVVEDADTLPLEEAAHDLVLHTMALHWANDPVGQLVQCRRALKPTPLNATYANAFHLMHDLRKMGENNALAMRPRHFTRRNVLTEASAIYASNFRADDGKRVNATFEVITLTGWAPADSQPQPLRPGSATTRLADALGTKEKPLK